MVQGSVGSGANFVTDGGFEIDVNGTGNVLSAGGFAEKGVEGIAFDSGGRVSFHHTFLIDTVFQTVQFPASITGLDTGLTQVD